MSLLKCQIEVVLREVGVDNFFDFPVAEFPAYKQQAVELAKLNQISALLTDIGQQTPKIEEADFTNSPYVVDVYLIETQKGNSMLSIYSPNISNKPTVKEVAV